MQNKLIYFNIDAKHESKYTTLLEEYHRDDLIQSSNLIKLLKKINAQKINITDAHLNSFHQHLEKNHIYFLDKPQAKLLLQNFQNTKDKTAIITKCTKILENTRNVINEFFQKNNCYISFLTPNSKDSWPTPTLSIFERRNRIKITNILDRPLISMRIFTNKPVVSFYGICKLACQMFKPLIRLPKMSLSITLMSLTAKNLMSADFTKLQHKPVKAMKDILIQNGITMETIEDSKDPIYTFLPTSIEIELADLATKAPNHEDPIEEKTFSSTPFRWLEPDFKTEEKQPSTTLSV